MGGAGGGLCLDSTSLHEMAWVMMLTAWQRLASHFYFPLTVFWESISLKHCMQTNRKQNLNADSKTTDTQKDKADGCTNFPWTAHRRFRQL